MSASGQSWAELIRAASEAVNARVDELTSLDSVVGDGDHGVNLRTGLQAAVAQIDADSTMSAPEVLKAAGDGLQESMAGAAGLLFGRFFVAAATSMEDSFDGPTIATVLEAGAAEVAKRGGASVGDRSMVDALVPAATAARAASDHGDTAVDVLSAAASAARAGAERTADLVPKVGRAARSTQAATGHPDAGATSIAIILRAWANTSSRSELDV